MIEFYVVSADVTVVIFIFANSFATAEVEKKGKKRNERI